MSLMPVEVQPKSQERLLRGGDHLAETIQMLRGKKGYGPKCGLEAI
jgi:hypothetical protein